MTHDMINTEIKLVEKQINENERAQSKFEAFNGFSNEELHKKHDALCDKMEELCRIRRNLAYEP